MIFYLNKYSCYELADAIYNWVFSALIPLKIPHFIKKAKNQGKIGSIETLKWISDGEDTDKTESPYNLSLFLIKSLVF